MRMASRGPSLLRFGGPAGGHLLPGKAYAAAPVFEATAETGALRRDAPPTRRPGPARRRRQSSA